MVEFTGRCLAMSPLAADWGILPIPLMPWETGKWRTIETGGRRALQFSWKPFPDSSHSAASVLSSPVRCVLACWRCCCFQHWFVCIQRRGTLQKQWNRHVVLTCCPLVSAKPASLWEPAVTWPGKSWREWRGPSEIPAPPPPPHKHSKKAFEANSFFSLHSTQSCMHRFASTPVHSPLVSFNCTHAFWPPTCATGMTNNKTQMPQRTWPVVTHSRIGGGAHLWSKHYFSFKTSTKA